MSEEPISSLDLMERAGRCFAEHLMARVPLEVYREIVVLCGPGNNGGDGLVIARYLREANWPVKVFLAVAEGSRTTAEYECNLQRWYDCVADARQSTSTYKVGDRVVEKVSCLLIDAVFGIGLSKPLRGYYAALVEAVNAAGAYVIAVDAPSGLPLDRHAEAPLLCVKAQETYTFQFYKLAYLIPETYVYRGEVSLIDIGLSLPEGEYDAVILEKEAVKRMLKRHKPSKYAHKGSMGHGLLVAGSAAMPGAALLAATAAMRGGIGKVTVHAPEAVCKLVPAVLPEALLSRDRNEECFSMVDSERLSICNAVAVGCGLGTKRAAEQGLKAILDEVQNPLILDADALNILAENKTWLAFLPPLSILTPHIKEFDRLAGSSENDFDRLGRLRGFAQRYGVVVVLKGANTAVAMPDGKLFFNVTGNPGMATAGSGDVLTGLLLALLAQGYTSAEAALVGVYLHAAAADAAAQALGNPLPLVASDIPMCFGQALKEL